MNYSRNASPANLQAVLAFFFGVLALIFCWIPVVSLVFVVACALLGVYAYRLGNRGASVMGFAAAAIALLVAVIIWISTSSCAGLAGANSGTDYSQGADYSDDYYIDEISGSDLSFSDLSGSDLSGSDVVDEPMIDEVV